MMNPSYSLGPMGMGIPGVPGVGMGMGYGMGGYGGMGMDPMMMGMGMPGMGMMGMGMMGGGYAGADPSTDLAYRAQMDSFSRRQDRH